MKALALALSLIVTPVIASPASDAFANSIALEAIDWGYAMAAARCNIRSDYWWETLNRGFLDYFYMQYTQAKLSNADAKEAEVTIRQLAAYATKKAAGDHSDCAPIINGPIMQRLDQVQSTMTGGYK